MAKDSGGEKINNFINLVKKMKPADKSLRNIASPRFTFLIEEHSYRVNISKRISASTNP